MVHLMVSLLAVSFSEFSSQGSPRGPVRPAAEFLWVYRLAVVITRKVGGPSAGMPTLVIMFDKEITIKIFYTS